MNDLCEALIKLSLELQLLNFYPAVLRVLWAFVIYQTLKYFYIAQLNVILVLFARLDTFQLFFAPIKSYGWAPAKVFANLFWRRFYERWKIG